MGTKTEVVGRFGGYRLEDDGKLYMGPKSWDVTDARASFRVGYHEVGVSYGRIAMLGAAGAGPSDKTQCYVTLRWPNGTGLEIRDHARTQEWGAHLAAEINRRNEVAHPGGRWATDPSGRHQYRWWNGEAWTDHVADNQWMAFDPLPA